MGKEVQYHVFKGLQRPLEFLGIRGRFLIIAGATAGGSFLVFMIGSLIFTRLIGFIAMLVTFVSGIISIYIKQKQGLHSKKRENTIFVYKSIFINPLK